MLRAYTQENSRISHYPIHHRCCVRMFPTTNVKSTDTATKRIADLPVNTLSILYHERTTSPSLKTLVIEQLLKSKYHATHLGVFNDRQLAEIDGILNRALIQATGLLSDFPTEGVQRPPKEMSLGLLSVRDRATQMGIEPLINTMNKDTERGFLAHSHTLRILTQFNH